MLHGAPHPMRVPRLKSSVTLAAAVVCLFATACDSRVKTAHEALAEAIERTEREGTSSSFVRALELASKAGDSQAALDLVRQAEAKLENRGDRLNGLMVRGLWRAGRLRDAERIAAEIEDRTKDVDALAALLDVHFARLGVERSAALADRLEKRDGLGERGILGILRARMAANKIAGLADLLERASTRMKTGSAGTTRTLRAIADFLRSVGDEPLNTISDYGSAAMPLNSAIRLPGCVVTINGEGPFRMILDSGAGNGVYLSASTAERLDLDAISRSQAIGFGGATDVGYTLLDSLRIGGIACRRVFAQIGSQDTPILAACDGIIGTGVFAQGRVTFDFEHAMLRVSRSSAEPAAGVELPIWVVADMHLLTEVHLADQHATAMLDSGANVTVLSPRWLKSTQPDHKPLNVPLPMFGVGPNTTQPQVGVGGDLDFAGRRFADFSGVSVEDLDGVISHTFGIQVDLLIAMPTFRQMRSWTIDYPRRRMWIHWLDEAGERNETP